MADRITLDVAHIAEQLELEVLEAGEGSVTFTSAEIGRPGLQFAGYYDHFLSKIIPLPLRHTSVLAVPRSIPISFENENILTAPRFL